MSGERHLERYRAAIERVRALTMLHLETGRAEPRADTVRELSRVLGEMERYLAASREGARDSQLAEALGLSREEVGFLWTVVAVSTDPRIAPHLSSLGMDHQRSATLAFHARIEKLPGEHAVGLGLSLGPAHPLVRHRILVAHDDLTPAAGTWQAPQRTAAFLAGDDTIDADLLGAGARVRVPDGLLVDDRLRPAYQRLGRTLGGGDVVAVVDGPIGVGRRTAVAVAARGLGRPVIALDLAHVAPGVAALERALAALVREARLTDAVPVVAGLDALPQTEGGEQPMLRLIARALDSVPGPCAVTTILQGTDLGTRKPQLRLSIPVPPTSTRRTLWDRALADQAPAVGDAERDLLAMRYRLGPGGIASAVRAASLLAGERGEGLTQTDLVHGVRNDIAERMGGLAARIQVRQGWDELVLGKDTMDQIRALTARVQHAHRVLEQWGLQSKLARGTGVAALFSGPPGTGKTMVAGLIARELDLELYQVDLSKVVSKWVGETEKQLSRIFDAADAGHALLLFDEADALFAKRTEVKGAIDRYANLEVNYLLQRVEAFGGITILTTNMDTSIDPALIRRLAAHVRFWPPEQDERLQLWKGFLTSGSIPLAADIDFAALAARFSEMSGANIRNAAITAAFLAASEDLPLSQKHLERAARGEYASMGRQLSGATK
jgi:hypothetical protein